MRKRLVTLMTMLMTVLCCNIEVHAEPLYEEGSVYVYPITPEDEAWAALDSVEAKIEVCRIPQKTLHEMSDEQLIQAVLDFPFINDVTAFNSYEQGVEHLQSICDAYAELVRRDTGFDSLIMKVTERSNERERGLTVDEEIADDNLSLLILCQDEFQNEISNETVEKINRICDLTEFTYMNMSDNDLLAVSAPKTPKGSAVSYNTYTCNHASGYHATVAAEDVKTYGVSLIAAGSCVFNCHSYAWYSQSTTNPYWISDPSIYMTDGSYTKYFSGTTSASSINLASGDKLYYTGLHSAIVTSSATGEPLATRTVKSKWGQHGIYSHTVTNVPSSYLECGTLSGWR